MGDGPRYYAFSTDLLKLYSLSASQCVRLRHREERWEKNDRDPTQAPELPQPRLLKQHHLLFLYTGLIFGSGAAAESPVLSSWAVHHKETEVTCHFKKTSLYNNWESVWGQQVVSSGSTALSGCWQPELKSSLLFNWLIHFSWKRNTRLLLFSSLEYACLTSSSREGPVNPLKL